MAVGHGNIAPLTEQSGTQSLKLNENDRALRQAVLNDGEQDLLGAYRRLGLACTELGSRENADLDNLRRVHAVMALVIYAALKATPLEELTEEMQQTVIEIQRCGLTRYVSANDRS